jgi:hypothetical protein
MTPEKATAMTHPIKKIVLISAALLLLVACASTPPNHEHRASYIVQAKDLTAAADAVRSVGGEITHELGVIRAVGALLTPTQVQRLRSVAGLTVHENRGLEVSGHLSPISTGRETVAEHRQPLRAKKTEMNR